MNNFRNNIDMLLTFMDVDEGIINSGIPSV